MKLKILVAAMTAALSTGALATGDQSQRQSQGAAAAQSHAQSHSPEIVRQAQQQLSSKGYEIGTADGQFGPRTQEGVKKFQQAQNLNATGQLDRQTLAALGIDERAAVSGRAGGSGSMDSGMRSAPNPPASSSQGDSGVPDGSRAR
jgi:peptidoglycan hydrolase-like protein with peptidoglycan-binding domain